MKRPNRKVNPEVSGERGAIAFLPLLVILVVTAMGVFGYLQLSFLTIGRIHSKRMAEEIAFNVANRIQSQLSNQNTASCAYQSEFEKMRDFSNLTPPNVSLSTTSVSSINCFLTDDEAALLSSLELTVAPLASANDVTTLSRLIRVKVIAHSYSDPNNPTASSRAVIEKLVSVKVASLGRFVLVFGGSGSGSKITVGSSVQLGVFGSTFVAPNDSGESLSLDEFVNGIALPYNSRAFFKRTVYTRAKSVTTQLNKFNQKVLGSVFNGGIQASMLSDIPLPLYTSTPAVWEKNIDYSYVYDKGNDASGVPLPKDMSPLPEISGGKTSSLGDSYQYNATTAAVTTFPDPSVILRLDETCSSTDVDQGDIKPMVLLKQNETVTLDFSRNPLPNASATPASNDVFCGLIRAKTLHIISKGTTILYGRFFVDQLKIDGNGLVYIVDPDIGSQLPIRLVPAGGLTVLRRQLAALAIYLGQPFYVPLARDPATAFASVPELLPRDVSFPFTNGCLSGTTAPPQCVCSDVSPSLATNPNLLCWPTYVASPERDLGATATAGAVTVSTTGAMASPAPTPSATPNPAQRLFQSGQGGATTGLIFTSEVEL